MRTRVLGTVETPHGGRPAVAVHKDDADLFHALRLDPSAWDRLDPRDFAVDPEHEVVFAEIRESAWKPAEALGVKA